MHVVCARCGVAKRATRRTKTEREEKLLLVGRQQGTIIQTEWQPGYGSCDADCVPPFHGDGVRTFHTSNFREAYRATQAPKFQHDLLHQVHAVISLVGKRLHDELSDDDFGAAVEEYMAKL